MAIRIPNKRRAVISYENMSDELREAFEEKYPHGYADYLGDLVKIDKPDGTSFYAVSVEIPDAIYLVKVKVRTDDYEAAHALHKEMGCICFENPAMGIYFIQDPDGYWLEVLPTR